MKFLNKKNILSFFTFLFVLATAILAFAEGEEDFREIIHPKKDFHIEDPAFVAEPYYQVFKEKFGFLPNLSIADLLFNMGPESMLVLQKCINNNI